MADEYLKYLTGNQQTQDPYAVNPFAESVPAGEEGVTPFADELPFRFTQFALNPATQATSGQAGRSPVARSPFTSGQAAAELRSLRDRIAGLPSTPPGAMPEAPIYPTGMGISSGLSAQPTTMDIPETQTPELRWGLPIKDYQVPARLLEDYPSRSPVDLAIQYGRGGNLRSIMGQDQKVDWDKYKESPMTTVQGYDMEKLLGADEWNKVLEAKSFDKGDEDRLYYNLATLPTTFDPALGNKENLASLASRSLWDQSMSQRVVNPAALEAAKEMGYDVSSGELPPGAEQGLMSSGFNQPVYILGGTAYNPRTAERLLRTNPEAGGIRGFAQQWAPKVIQTGAASVIGTAGGMALAPLGATGGGLAGLAGITPGAAATGVNIAGNAAASMAVQKGLQEAGIPLNSPLAQMLLTAGMGAAGGAMAGGSAPVESGATVPTENQFGIYELMEQNNLSPGDIMDVMGEENFIQSFGDPQVFTEGYDKFTGVGSGVSASTRTPSGPDFKGQGLKGLQSGLETYQGMTGAPRGGGINQANLYDPNTDPALMATYESDMANYENEMIAYNKAVEDYKLQQQLQAEYEQKMSEFAQRSNAYKTYQELQSKQKGIASSIAGNLASNPFYDPEENLFGIQSRIV